MPRAPGRPFDPPPVLYRLRLEAPVCRVRLWDGSVARGAGQRRDARGHLSFGFGRHLCLGRHLARTQLRIALGTLHRRVPSLRLAVERDTLAFRHDKMIYGVHELPVVRSAPA
ncbi:cytochrome P450 [Streptomyces hyaluromycini]|uniref:Cytochrome P450 n=1 Tax=Streptomyces hyaluromycini TaxID=1377993 RepID=A0ABV1XE21_9ACTN